MSGHVSLRTLLVVSAVAWLLASMPVIAQPSDGAILADRRDGDATDQLDRDAWRLYEAGDYSGALGAWTRLLEIEPGNARAVYNAACCQSRLGRPEKAAGLLQGAVTRGFIDFDRMRHDPDLDSIREHETYLNVLAQIPVAYARAADALEREARALLGPDALIERDAAARLIHAASVSTETLALVRSRLDGQIRWQRSQLFGDEAERPWVLVMVPSPRIAESMIQTDRVAGAYDHDRRRLVTREVGPTLRHEITHALHHAQMDRLGQRHPMWIQEGLASLFEFYRWEERPGYSPELVVEDSARLNLVIRLREINALTPWDEIMSMTDGEFMGDRARARYAEVRAILHFVADRGLLTEWYRTYVASTYHDDPTGKAALEIVFDSTLEEIEREFRLWVGQKQGQPEEIYFGRPALGVRVTDQMANDGVLVTTVFNESAADRAGFAVRDVIQAIDDQPVFSAEEVVRAVAGRHRDEKVKVRIRRKEEILTVELGLKPVREPGPTELSLIEVGIKA